MANTVQISGMFGSTFLAGSPVVIEISGLEWGEGPEISPLTVVRLEVLYNSIVAGEFRIDAAGQTDITFDISPALRAIWADIDYTEEANAAQNALNASQNEQTNTRPARQYSICIHTEYFDRYGNYTETTCQDSEQRTIIPAGRCLPGRLTEWERLQIGNVVNYIDTRIQGSNTRFGDASTKPTSSPERVGIDSITSWVDVVKIEGTFRTYCAYWPADTDQSADSTSAHAPLVLRDTVPYVDFLFVNRRGAVETCSAATMEAMAFPVETTQYARTGRPSFGTPPSLLAIAQGGHRKWNMSSGHQTREWAEWWATEFLTARQWWMRLGNRYVPVTVAPAAESTNVYDRSRQSMPSVNFTVTLTVEG